MCRLFGAIHDGGLDAGVHLVRSRTSLLAQSAARKERLQRDGWGTGFYGEDGEPARTVSTGAPYRQRARFAAAAAAVRGGVVLGHVRRASNPLHLPHRALLHPENQQPFVHGRWMFVHNGILNLPDLLAKRLGRFRGRLAGNNDSEVYFWLLVGALERTGSVREAFREVLRVVEGNWERAPEARRREAGRPFVGLNAMLTDGERLWAACLYDGYRAKAPDRWLCPVRPARPIFEMCYRVEEGGRGLVAASERTEPRGVWERLPDGSLLEARMAAGRVRWKVARLRRGRGRKAGDRAAAP